MEDKEFLSRTSEQIVEDRKIISHENWLGRTGVPVRQVEVFKDRVRGGRGYLYIDNRASGGQLLEFNTLTCAHCDSVVVLNPKRTRSRNYCRKCNAYVCDNKVCATECHPIKQSLELAQLHPEENLMGRGKDGSILYDPRIEGNQF